MQHMHNCCPCAGLCLTNLLVLRPGLYSLFSQLGSAITYLYEVGPTGHKGLTASTGQMATCPGIILGIFMCEAVLLGCTHDQLLLWGWRVPFLVSGGG